MIPVAIASFGLLMVVVYLVARPFIAPVRYEAVATLEQLHADLDRLRAQLRELDMDFETGKLAREEYERFHARRLQQIEATTRAIREAEGFKDVTPTITPESAEIPSTEDLELELERRIAARKHELEELEALACPGCGTTIDPDDRFCRKCGADLATAETR